MPRQRRSFGAVRKLPSGRYQASYVGADGRRHLAPTTFATKSDADAFLRLQQADLTRDAWLPPLTARAGAVTLAAYSQAWIDGRDLKPATRKHYRMLLRLHIAPALGDVEVAGLTPAMIRTWHGALAATTGPTMRAHAYGLLRTILNTAVGDDLIGSNPCRIRGAGQTKRVVEIEPATVAELELIVAALPPRYRTMIMLAAWCALRFGEITELRRRNVDTKAGVLWVRHGVVRVDGEYIVDDPKSVAGRRRVNIPPHLLPMVRDHLLTHVAAGRDALLFPSAGDPAQHMHEATMRKVFYRARRLAGRPDLRFHDLRHTGATLAAMTGATLAELMARLGHSTAHAALRYQHVARDRDKEIAAALSRLAQPTAPAAVVDLTERRAAQ